VRLEALLDARDIAAGMLHHALDAGIEQQRVEQVLDRHVLVAAAEGLAGREGDGDLDFGADAHQVGSVVRRSGIPFS